jgi:hypothetical protein
MPGKISGRRAPTNIMVTCGPDVCWTPMGSGMVKVGYNSAAFMDPSKRLATSVFNNKRNDFMLNTRAAKIKGHKPGTGKGVKVAGYLTYSHVKTASGSVFAEGWAAVRDRDPAWINHPDIGPTEPRRTEKTQCEKDIEQIEKETQRTTASNDPIARNKAITSAYSDLAQGGSNPWIGLASIVSAQAGCAIGRVATARSYMPPGKDALDDATGMSFSKNMMGALGDTNKGIFQGIYPYEAFRKKYGYDRMKKCYAATGRKIPPGVENAYDKLQRGDARRGADALANYEQRVVVQPIYEKYTGTFQEMRAVNAVQRPFSGSNLYDIPVSSSCSDPNTVPFQGSIANPNDRVNYYGDLMDRYMRGDR